jgi:hypothetical protein
MGKHPSAAGSLKPGVGTFIVGDAQGVGHVRPWWESSTRGPFFHAVERNAAEEVVWECGHEHYDPTAPLRGQLQADRCVTDHGRKAKVERYSKSRAVTQREALAQQAQMQHLIATAPPIVKTSGLDKATRLTKSWQEHFDLWRAMLGRPMTVGDLSPQMRRAFHMHTLPDETVITRALVLRAAKQYLGEAERQMRAQQSKRTAKEAFWVPAGVR